MTQSLWVATLVAPTGAVLSEQQVHSVVEEIAVSHGKVENIVRLGDGCAADVFFVGEVKIESSNDFDLFIQPVATRCKKILVADMESTIIEQEMLDELAARIGIGEKVADITRRAMNGELDFNAALTERVGLLKGQPESLLFETASLMTFSPGAQDLVAVMKRAGGKAWLVSGGFTFFIKKIAEQAGFDRFYGNELIVENGVITGEVALPILGKGAKKTLLEKACAEYGCSLAETLTIGDGANDVPMLQACNSGGGLGVAYRAKPKVRAVVPYQINCSDLSSLIYAQGLHFSP